ncbi:MAG: cyclopropane-fatty-acyl-phospholipid synthase [Nevskia sp.]|nr:cyclopropane-fatty-acyl-phospholipid synthase [Nevskia sp.]
MQTILARVGRKFRQGSLEFRAQDGSAWTLGHSEPRAILRLNDPAALLGMLLNPQLRVPEGYMDGAWEPADGDLLRVLEVAMRMRASAQTGGFARWAGNVLARVGEFNNPLRSRHNVHHHYDLDESFYADFLDRDLHYSCAYFREPGMDLEAAQQAKCAHIAAKLDLKPGARVLDIGCGWGSLALYLARNFDVQVTGITLSEEQHKVAQRRAAERRLGDRVEFRLQDYRDTRGQYDAIVSVGMFEHVGRPQYPTFFRQVHDLLAPQGTALLHTIGRSTPPAGGNPWIRKHIFPGGYIPSASEIMTAVEPQELILNDLEVWRLHYAETLAEWNRRFQARRAHYAATLGERFCRMWEFYLLVSEAGFRWGDLLVFHAQLTRSRERLPLTRDYLYRGETPPSSTVRQLPLRRRG